MFDITGDDIAKLDDELLRELVGLLCEAECRNAGQDPKSVTWGGNQSAADGGFDVVVRARNGVAGSTLLGRSMVGIQVKKTDLPPAEITKEMRPGGLLRKHISELVSIGGCYLIASSGADTSNAMLQRRERAMRAALSHEDPSEKVQLQFLDRGQLATWVRQHPSMVLWVRRCIGRPLAGWRPYGDWANAPGGVEEEYLVDKELRISNGRKPSDEPIDALSGIAELREALRTQGACLRLAGLSGVGKTRMVQALFDDRVGGDALEKNRAYYCDVGDDPQPPPKILIENLVAMNEPGIVIVDNCQPELHASLRETVSKEGCCVSLLTIEYDVRDDLPTKTGVYFMESASIELTGRLIRKRFKHITPIDAQTIAEFSGGNARVAIALAETVELGETLTDFRDETLLERLFLQRNRADQRLQRAAEVLSLVYSFDGEDTDTSSSELEHLGKIVAESADELFGHVADLSDRKLVQSRSKWRAVLPHALANRLASNALKRTPSKNVVAAITGSNSQRLIKSFTRRLAFLHDHPVAVEIARGWLGEGNLVGDAAKLNAFGVEMFKNLAPIAPEDALAAIERSAKNDEQNIYGSEKAVQLICVKTTRLIAYDMNLFIRCCSVLKNFAVHSSNDEVRVSAKDRLISLFPMYLSGTHATIDQRISFIGDLSRNNDALSKELAIEALDAALQTARFTSGEDYQFGARPRNYGYRPKNWDEQRDWYRRHLDTLKRLTLTSGQSADRARGVLRQRFRGLWNHGGVELELGDTLQELRAKTDWIEGWIAVKETIYFDAPKSSSASGSIWLQLESLERKLRPTTLVERARAYAMQDRSYGLDYLEDNESDKERDLSDQMRTVEEITRGIGAELAEDRYALDTLLIELVSPGGNRISMIGEGLAENAKDPGELWHRVRCAAMSVPPEQRNLAVFNGYLVGLNRVSPDMCQQLLDELVEDELLGAIFPALQCAVGLDRNAYRRLRQSVDVGVSPTNSYCQLAYGESHAGLSDDELVQLLTHLGKRDDSDAVILMILGMRLFQRPETELPSTGVLMEYCREFICDFDFEVGTRGKRQLDDHALKEVASKCFRGGEVSEQAAREACNKVASLIGKGRLYVYDTDQFLSVLARHQPQAFLDSFLGRDHQQGKRLSHFLLSDLRHSESPMEAIPPQSIVEWCSKAPDTRWLTICRSMKLFRYNKQTRMYEWRRVFDDLVERACNLRSCLDEIYRSLEPMAWSGSRADIMANRLSLLGAVIDHRNGTVADWAKEKKLEFRQAIEASRKWEENAWPRTEESFE